MITSPLDKLDSDTKLSAKIERVVREEFGNNCCVENLRLATLGGSNRTILFDVIDKRTVHKLVLRTNSVPAEFTPFLAVPVQFQVLNVVWKHGLPVPEPLFLLSDAHGLGQGYIMSAVDGETLPKHILNKPEFECARGKVISQTAEILAQLHSIPAKEFSFLNQVPDSADPLSAQIKYYDGYGQPHPALEYAYRWLLINRPKVSSRQASLIHGDYRNGNLMIHPERGIRAVLDWECSFSGDFHADLGWFCMRSWRQKRSEMHAGGFGTRQELYEAYQRVGGREVNHEMARWWEIFSLAKWAGFNIMQAHGHCNGGRRSPAFAACGRNTALIEYDLMRTIAGEID